MRNLRITDSYLWGGADFDLNKAFWRHWGHDAALPFRVRNLVDLTELLRERRVSSWLYGGSLRDVFTNGALSVDHDDDVMCELGDLANLPRKFFADLKAHGFSVIRNSTDMISVSRDGRYIDIHPCDRSSLGTIAVHAHGVYLVIHEESEEILRKKYKPRFSIDGLFSAPVTILVFFRESLNKLNKLRQQPEVNFADICILSFRELRRVLSRATPSMHRAKRSMELSMEDFLALKIDADASLNWDWRGAHLAKVVTKGETFGQAIQRIKNDPSSLDSFVTETPLSNTVEEPINISRSFWKTGNNFFLFPFLFGYRHLVVPYHAANLYIRAKRGPELYSKQYFEALPVMSDAEIATFLRENPLEITRGALSSGRHRAIAMAGRLYRGEPYIPLFAVKAS